jgi:hypothetical protein
MQGVLNEAEFYNPRRLKRWIGRAGGWTPDLKRQEGGIWNPKEVKLRRGQDLFKIGHSRSSRGPVPDEVNLSSPWWIESETFQSIAVSSNILGADRQHLARLKLSVSERYGVFDTIFCVRVLEPLGALRGEGNPVYDPPEPGSPTSPPVWAFPGTSLIQCYIPGLRDLHGSITGLAAQAFTVTGRFPVSQWMMMDAGWLTLAGSVRG